MIIREAVEKKAREKYSDNSYVKNRIEKELDYFEKNDRFKEIETILKVKECIKDQNVFVFPTGMLSLYLLDLDFINPMPAHYYNSITKEVIFDDSALYGVDLPINEDLHRDGFNITEEYLLNLKKDLYLEVYLYEKYIGVVKEIVGESFDITVETEESDKNGHKEKISFGKTSIVFNDYSAEEFFGKNLQRDVSLENFSKYLSEDAVKRLMEDEAKSIKINSFKDMVEILALSKLSLVDCSNKFEEFIASKFPKTREDIFIYFAKEGYSLEESSDLAYKISFGQNPKVDIKDEEIKKYFASIQYAWPKAVIVSIFLRDYFKICM